jgi:acyl-CoA thioester hydrolase
MTERVIADSHGLPRKWPGIALVPARLEPGHFRFRRVETLRFADADLGGHVTHAAIVAFCASSRSLLLADCARCLPPHDACWITRQLTLDFREALKCPGTAEIGTTALRLGRSSIRFNQAVFQDGQCRAVAGALMVLVDANGVPMAIPAAFRERLGAMGGAARG